VFTLAQPGSATPHLTRAGKREIRMKALSQTIVAQNVSVPTGDADMTACNARLDTRAAASALWALRFWRAASAMLVLAAVAMAALPAEAQPVKLGEGAYLLSPKPGDKPVPRAPFRTEAMLKRAAPTNQWYSTLAFSDKPEAVFVQPITVKATPAGLEFALPSKEAVATVRQDVEIRYPHRDPLIISPVAFEPGRALLANADDWSIDISMARGADDLLTTVARGHPFASLRVTRGDLRVRLPAAGQRLHAGADPRVLALQVGTKTYALFGPTGVAWEAVSPTEWLARLPAGKGYLSVAALPDNKAETLALFTRHAYAFITRTRVEWRYDEAASRVDTTFTATTQVMEGADNGPLLGLYPHHWFRNAAVEGRLGLAFNTVRGPLRLLAAPQFTVSTRYNGFVPFWPAITGSPRQAQLEDVMDKDFATAGRELQRQGRSAYWAGKGLLRTMKLAERFEQQGDLARRDRLLDMTKKRMEEWLGGDSSRGYVQRDEAMGLVSIYPDEFFAVAEINDHHFWYGYWIRTAAELALRDPAWMARDRWGGMIELLIADIATAERGRADFPFLRNWDPYESHTWANGIGVGEFGNNNESSSESINAWIGLILWGEITGNQALRDLGVYLYTSEIEAINHYWFDIHGLVFAPEYRNAEVSLLFGGMYQHNTWWTDDPRQIKGINLLPVTTAHTYLGRDPAFVRRSQATLPAETALWNRIARKPNPPPPRDIWQDIFAKYLALADPEEALKTWDRWGSVEIGASRSFALSFMLGLQDKGLPDFGITADTPLHAVFRRADGRRTYLAFNARKAPLEVRFSDGQRLTVPPGQLARISLP
jgi:endoglucanase Acf2